jgi:hypothetical protein
MGAPLKCADWPARWLARRNPDLTGGLAAGKLIGEENQ